MSGKFTRKAQEVLRESLNLASDMGHSYIGSEHILLAILCSNDGAASKILLSKGITQKAFEEKIIDAMGRGTKYQLSASDMTPRAKKIIEDSATLADIYGYESIGREHILMAILNQNDCVAIRMLESLNVSPTAIKNQLEGYLSSFSCEDNQPKDKGAQKDKKKNQLGGILNYGKNLVY